MRFMSFIVSIASFLGFMCCCGTTNSDNVTVVEPVKFQQLIEADSTAILIDARSQEEYNEGHLANAFLLNWLDRQQFEEGTKTLDTSKHVYIYCRSGRRSNAAANALAAKGFKVTDMEGGIIAWEKQGLPLVK